MVGLPNRAPTPLPLSVLLALALSARFSMAFVHAKAAIESPVVMYLLGTFVIEAEAQGPGQSNRFPICKSFYAAQINPKPVCTDYRSY